MHHPMRMDYQFRNNRRKISETFYEDSDCRSILRYPASLFLSVCLVLLLITGVESSSSNLDLSYLYRTKSNLVALAIQEALQTQEDLKEVDVSASFINKDVDDLLALFHQEDVMYPRRTFGIVAQRNQWTHKEATLLLESIVGPDSQEPTTVVPTKKKKKRTRKPSLSDDMKGNSDDLDVNATTKNDSVALSDNVSTREILDGANNSNSSNEATLGDLVDSKEDANNNTKCENKVDAPSRLVSQAITRVDLGWNDLGVRSDIRSSTDKAWHQVLQRTIRNRERCPKDLRFPVCGLGPAACRAIGKGLMERFENIKEGSSDELPDPISIQLVGNHAIRDPGVAALSAAIRNVVSKRKGCTVLNTLDLSGCGITDTGAETLAIALQHSPYCVRHLDLSNNLISNDGAAALGRSLAMREKNRWSKIETLDLSNNKGIDDIGAKALALAIEAGSIENLILRSCHIRADGAAAMVKSLRVLALSEHRPAKMQLDLSGNPLGILRKQAKSGSGKYSVSALKSKATATTAAYMNLIGKTVQKSLKDFGIADGLDTLESDDEEESQSNEKNDEDPTMIKCGALAMADALLLEHDEDDVNSSGAPSREVFKVSLALRHCAFDTRASEALAAIRQSLLLSSANMDTRIDVAMNNILEDDTVAALRGDTEYEGQLSEMAERYLEAMEALQASRQRAVEAAKVARHRMKAEDEMENAWGGDLEMARDYGYPDEHDDGQPQDSDAEYDREEDEEDFF